MVVEAGFMTSLKTSDFDYTLPKELIAQTPLDVRDRSRLAGGGPG